MLARMTHICIYEECALADLGEHGCQIGGEPTASLAALGTDDRQHLAGGALKPTDGELSAQYPKSLHAFGLRTVCGDHVICHTAYPATWDNWMFELAGER